MSTEQGGMMLWYFWIVVQELRERWVLAPQVDVEDSSQTLAVVAVTVLDPLHAFTTSFIIMLIIISFLCQTGGSAAVRELEEAWQVSTGFLLDL